MRCPPGLVFDDLYQRCEWPKNGPQSPMHRLSSLKNKFESIKDEAKLLSVVTTTKPKLTTVSSLKKDQKVSEP